MSSEALSTRSIYDLPKDMPWDLLRPWPNQPCSFLIRKKPILDPNSHAESQEPCCPARPRRSQISEPTATLCTIWPSWSDSDVHMRDSRLGLQRTGRVEHQNKRQKHLKQRMWRSHYSLFEQCPWGFHALEALLCLLHTLRQAWCWNWRSLESPAWTTNSRHPRILSAKSQSLFEPLLVQGHRRKQTAKRALKLRHTKEWFWAHAFYVLCSRSNRLVFEATSLLSRLFRSLRKSREMVDRMRRIWMNCLADPTDSRAEFHWTPNWQ